MYVSLNDTVTPLRFNEVLRINPVKKAAFQDDPVFKYIYDTPDANKSRTTQLARDTADTLQTLYYVQCNGAWAIDDRSGFILYKPAINSYGPHRKALQRALRKVLNAALRSLIPLAYSEEQKRRIMEIATKQDAIIRKLWGKELEDMVTVDLLAVAPENQGLGYGSALVEVAVAEADRQSRRAWLSTRPATVGFYQRFGFLVVAEYTVGENNPTWKAPPVERVIMMRESSPRMTNVEMHL